MDVLLLAVKLDAKSVRPSVRQRGEAGGRESTRDGVTMMGIGRGVEGDVWGIGIGCPVDAEESQRRMRRLDDWSEG
jgi:hypothetical protein